MKQTLLVLKCSSEWSLCWFCFEFWPSCTILLVVECCRLAQCICSLILGYFVMFYWLWSTYFCAFVCWLPCIFTCLEIDILYTLAFSQKMALLSSRAHWCQWKSLTIRVLGSGWLMEDPHSCSTHEADITCFEMFKWVKSLLISFGILAELYNSFGCGML